jgi:glycerol-3-phosphate dehydrogenase subunit C
MTVEILETNRIAQTSENCTKCNICQAYCPVLAVNEEFAGPKYAGPQAQRFRATGASGDLSTDLCTGCGICMSACPNDVAVSDIIALARAEAVERGTRRLSFAQKMVNRPDTIGRLASRAPAVANAVLGNWLVRSLLEKLSGLSADAPLPRIHGPAFRDWFERLSQPENERLIYFPGCAGEYYDPKTAIASVTILNRLGFRVVIPPPACCSLPMLSTGEWDAARPRAAKLIDTLDALRGDHTKIVGTSTSCMLTLKRKYRDYLNMGDEGARQVSASAKDICEFIRDHAFDRFAERFRPLPIKVFYHPPCQLRGHGIGTPALDLMQKIPELEIVVSKVDCCGIGGTYGYRSDRRMVTESISAPLIDQIKESRADTVVCDSETCRWHISALSGVEAVHPVDILLRALNS